MDSRITNVLVNRYNDGTFLSVCSYVDFSTAIIAPRLVYVSWCTRLTLQRHSSC
jgi:hypothetical protein